MNNNIIKTTIIDLISSKTYLILLLLIICGSYVFTSYNPVTSNYITNINYTLTMHQNYYTFIVFPVIVFLTVNVYYRFSKNSMILLRVKNKKAYLKLQLKANFFLITVLFIQILIAIMISINLNRSVDFKIINDEYYNIPNIVVLLVNLFKVYMCFIVLQLIVLLSVNLLNKQLSLFTVFIYIVLIHLSSKLQYTPVIGYLMPSSNIYSYIIYDNILQSFITSFAYYLVEITILIIILKKNIIKNSIEKEIL